MNKRIILALFLGTATAIQNKSAKVTHEVVTPDMMAQLEA
jgi:hypothetical protein